MSTCCEEDIKPVISNTNDLLDKIFKKLERLEVLIEEFTKDSGEK